jgi:anti-sigma B factor antagonist
MKRPKADPYSLGDTADEARATPQGPIRDQAWDVTERRGLFVINILPRNLLDGAEIENLHGELGSYFGRKSAPKVIFDMQCVYHLSSAALGMFVNLKTTIEGSGGAMRLCNVRSELQQIFKLTKLHKVLKIKESVDAAAASF